MRLRTYILLLLSTLGLFFVHCSREIEGCSGPTVDLAKVEGVRTLSLFNGPQAFLILPNPVDATNVRSIQAMDSRSISSGQEISLSNPSQGGGLDNGFLKVRIHSLADDISSLAQAASGGRFNFQPSDIHYAETMAYHGVTSVMSYVQSLGFSINQQRPLYVLVQSNDDPEDASSSFDPSFVNAYYMHNKYETDKPRMIQVYGKTDYSLNMDRDTYWHEFGHLFNESVSREVGFDEATMSGATFVESRVIHECLADHLAESLGNKGYIGRWGAHNFKEIPEGEPLRTAYSKSDKKNKFSGVANNDGGSQAPENYAMAEWCTRVLWQVREDFLKEDPNTGSVFSDRMLFASLALLQKDASLSDFRKAVLQSDQTLHCGLHEKSIEKAFEDFGFQGDPSRLEKGLNMKVTIVGIKDEADGSVKLAKPNAKSLEIFFVTEIQNPNSVTARNVRVEVEALDSSVIPMIYMQGLGDVLPGKSVKVGDATIEDVLNGVSIVLDKNAVKGDRIRYRLRIRVENGPETYQDGEIPL